MCRWYTNSVNKAARMAALIALAVVVCLGQTTSGPQPDASWHRVGTTTVAEGLAGPATGAVTNVWYRGGSLLARTASGRVFESADLSHWRLNTAGIPPAFDSMASDARASAATLPETGARVVVAGDRLYASGVNYLYSSRDGGTTWVNLTAANLTSSGCR